jgi:hypothetical protein
MYGFLTIQYSIEISIKDDVVFRIQYTGNIGGAGYEKLFFFKRTLRGKA